MTGHAILQASSPAISRQLLGRHSSISHGRESASMRRSVGMRESMCLFLQLEGAVEGQNGFEPEEVLQVGVCRILCFHKALQNAYVVKTFGTTQVGSPTCRAPMLQSCSGLVWHGAAFKGCCHHARRLVSPPDRSA